MIDTPLKRTIRRKEKTVARPKPSFDTSGLEHSSLPVYDPLGDHHLRTFFESKYIRKTLFDAGLVDHDGRILEADRHRSKLFRIEQDFAEAELKDPKAEQEEAARQELKRVQWLLKQEKAAHSPISTTGLRRRVPGSPAPKSTPKSAVKEPRKASKAPKVAAAEKEGETSEKEYSDYESDHSEKSDKSDRSGRSDKSDKAVDDDNVSEKSADDKYDDTDAEHTSAKSDSDSDDEESDKASHSSNASSEKADSDGEESDADDNASKSSKSD